jgi:hypothetical protein
MKHVWNVLNEGRRQIERHPFFTWLNSEGVPLHSRFIFSPVMIDFIMSFADLNKWFLRYQNPRGPFEHAINEHTEEDATHSRLFVENWTHLRLGDTLDWAPSKALWWMFHGEQSAVVRRFGMEILVAAVNFPDPLVRFPMMEAIEICGDVFFANTARIAQRIAEEEHVEHIYYGKFHRDRETGHLQSDEGCFVRAVLSQEQRQHAERLVGIVYSNFVQVLDQLLAFSMAAVTDHRQLQRGIESEYLHALVMPADAAESAPQYLPTVSEQTAHADQLPLLGLLQEEIDNQRAHEFLDWLKHGDQPALDKLRSFAPLWAIDIVGYRDFNELVLRYPAPRTDAERAINQWSSELSSHGVLYLQDWKALRLDSVLGWRMVETIAYYFLGEHTELHRRNMAKVKKHAMYHTDPKIRWWLMYALEQSMAQLLAQTAPLAREAEEELGITLNFWAHRHGLNEPRRPDGAAVEFLALPLSDTEKATIEQIITTVFGNMQELLDLSYSVARSGIFITLPASVPPRHVSEIVLRGAVEPRTYQNAAGAV